MIVLVTFFLCIILYTYAIYPLLIYFLAADKNTGFDSNPTDEKLPSVTVIIPVYNAESILSARFDNLQQLGYPKEKLEIIFVSDGSTDGTNERLLKQKDKYKIILLKERTGKESALQSAINQARNEILCFIDVCTTVNTDGIRHLCKHFVDESIGAVSSIDCTGSGIHKLEAFHVQYECNIRIYEAAISSSVGVSGSFFATRKTLFKQVPETACSDLGIALQCVVSGFKAIVENKAVGAYSITEDVGKEFHRKVRTIIHGMNTLFLYKNVFDIRKYGWFSWQLISHKIFRWLSPLSFSLVALILSSQLLITITKWQLVLLISFIIPILCVRKLRKFFISNGHLFVAYNLAVIIAFVNFLLKKEYRIWEPTQRR